MSTPPPPAPVVQKKRGLGCCGCGCVVLAILLALVLGFFGMLGYVAYSGFVKLTSATPAAVPTFDGGDEMYNTAKQKIVDLDHNLHAKLAAKVRLSANEINTLVARDPHLTQGKVQFYVTFNGDQSRVQSSVPSETASLGIVKNRYLNSDITTGIHLESGTKNLMLDLKSVDVGDVRFPDENMPSLQILLNGMLARAMHQDPSCGPLLQQAKAIQIENGDLVIEIQ